nr:aminoglycoside 6-adenylyltransferase [Peribacillus deserti]
MPLKRSKLLEAAMEDLTQDSAVAAVYQSGSLAKGNFDSYSDIDLHIIVPPEAKSDFIKNKRCRSAKWGEVLFYEEPSSSAPVIVTHYACFVKVDTWYKTLEEVTPTLWLKGVEVLYDPQNQVRKIIEESAGLTYQPAPRDVVFWRGKVLAFIHEIYRSVMREELYYALSNLDKFRWLIASGWYMEQEKFLDSSYGVWSKIDGKRSHLEGWQLSLLESWDCQRNSKDIMKTLVSMVPEFLRLNEVLSNKTGIEAEEEYCKRIIEMAY